VAEGIFYAQLVLEHAGRQLRLDSRPSDAVALALRTEAPIYVAEAVLEQAGILVEETAEPGGGAEPGEGPASGSAEARRLGAGWLDQKMIQRRCGAYLVYRYRVGKTQTMKYLGKVGRLVPDTPG
jgi:bifunctional DNase/RNase